MRKLLILIAILICVSARADLQIVTAIVTVTNTAGTTNGDTITVNGTTRTFTNNVQNASVEIAMGTDITISASNMLTAFATYLPAQTFVTKVSTNAMQLQSYPGYNEVVTISTNWGTVTFTTNTLTTAIVVRVPVTVEGNAQQTNIESGLVYAIGDNKTTNVFYESSPAFVNFLGLTNLQTVTGRKTFSNQSNSFTGAISGIGNVSFINTTGSTETVTIGATGLGGSTQSIQSTPAGLVINGALFLAGNLTVGDWAITGTAFAITTNFNGDGGGLTNVPISALQSPAITNGQAGVALTSQQMAGTNVVRGDIAYPRYSLNTLANGNNSAIPVGTNVFVEVSGPTAAFTICGIYGGPNRDGKILKIKNATGFTMTIANQSGTDPTPANRILTGLSADEAFTNNPGMVTLIYDGNAARWIIDSHN